MVIVRDDLDNTVRDCQSCHTTGEFGAPVAKHRGLPPKHLDELACQTCHIPQRFVEAVQVQASDVFNPGSHIPSKGKHLWVFYGPDMEYRNHYGELVTMAYDDKPTDMFRPVLVWYKGKIRPANRVHTAWPAIRIQGKEGLMQPKMSDIYKMWTEHQANPSKHPALAKIVDDNGDGVIEVNRREEIDALIEAVTQMLNATGYPMEGKQVLWVMNDRAYSSGTEYETIPTHDYEASPYGNVHTYNHEVLPARAALGSGGCVDCHSADSDFFFASVVKYPFGDDGKPVLTDQLELLGLTGGLVKLGAFREGWVKPAMWWGLLLVLLVCALHYITIGPKRIAEDSPEPPVQRFNRLERMAHFALMVTFLALAATGLTTAAALLPSSTIEAVHQWHHALGYVFIVSAILSLALWLKPALPEPGDGEWLRKMGGYLNPQQDPPPASRFNAGQKVFFWLSIAAAAVLGASGILAIFASPGDARQLAHTVHLVVAALSMMLVLGRLYLATLANPGTLRGMLEGTVSRQWARHHHSLWHQ